MQLEIMKPKEQSAPKKPSVVIDPNPKREREFLDASGNIIDPKTKQIIKKYEE